MTNTSTTKPSHDVYVVDGEGKEAFWTRIGAAWAHNDGEGFSIQLTALPLTGRLTIRKPKPQRERTPEQERGR